MDMEEAKARKQLGWTYTIVESKDTEGLWLVKHGNTIKKYTYSKEEAEQWVRARK